MNKIELRGCPLNCKNPDCDTCPYSKEGLCDYPYIGNVKCKIDTTATKLV